MINKTILGACILLISLILIGCAESADVSLTELEHSKGEVVAEVPANPGVEETQVVKEIQVVEETEAVKEQLIEEPVVKPLVELTVKEFVLVAKQWEFVPNLIEVNIGDAVRLKIKSIDVTHGFVLSSFGISQSLEPGKETIVEFVADKIGTFSFFCNVPCGKGHSNMDGTLIVK